MGGHSQNFPSWRHLHLTPLHLKCHRDVRGSSHMKTSVLPLHPRLTPHKRCLCPPWVIEWAGISGSIVWGQSVALIGSPHVTNLSLASGPPARYEIVNTNQPHRVWEQRHFSNDLIHLTSSLHIYGLVLTHWKPFQVNLILKCSQVPFTKWKQKGLPHRTACKSIKGTHSGFQGNSGKA